MKIVLIIVGAVACAFAAILLASVAITRAGEDMRDWE